MVLQDPADADEATAIFFNGVNQVKTFCFKFVAQAGAIVICLNIDYADVSIKSARTENGNLVIKYLDLYVIGIGVAPMHNSIK